MGHEKTFVLNGARKIWKDCPGILKYDIIYGETLIYSCEPKITVDNLRSQNKQNLTVFHAYWKKEILLILEM